jgi:UDP-glucuronate decarboxylase
MFYASATYREDLRAAVDMIGELKKLQDASILITGASGLIGSFIVDVLMYCNEVYNMNIDVYACGRSEKRLKQRFLSHLSESNFHLLEFDVSEELKLRVSIDYIIHSASNAYPAAYSLDPVGTISGNVLGGLHLLEFAKNNGCRRFLYISSGEVYGQGECSLQSFDESYSGYVDPIKVRSCYPLSKRLAENLCVAYSDQFNVDTVIVRPSHIYGPNTTSTDNRATSQFFSNAICDRDIILKSKGEQIRSYCYVADCVSAIITVLLKGKRAEVYNIANKHSVLSIFDMANAIANIAGRKVVFDIPEVQTNSGYTPITRGVLDPNKLEQLGWHGQYSVNKGCKRSFQILKEVKGNSV